MISNENLSPQYATAIDVYSFSIVMWELLFEDSPYVHFTNKEKLFFESSFENSPYFNLANFNVLTSVVKGLRPIIPFHDESQCMRWCKQFTKEKYDLEMTCRTFMSLSQLIQICWSFHPQERPSFNQIVSELIEIRQSLGDQ